MASAATRSASDRASSGASPVLTAAGLEMRFGDRYALRDVSFEVQSGELLGIIGPNGAGKTTLLSILAGSLLPTGGRIESFGGEIGWVPQQPSLYSKLTVAENLRLFANLQEIDDVDAAVDRMLEQTGLGDRADDLVEVLSGGNRQRVNVAIGLLSDPPVLLLDEPSASLDPRQRERLWDFIVNLTKQGTTVVYATHNVIEVERYADRVLVLADGELLWQGTPRALEDAVGGDERDFEAAFVAFLHARGH